MNGKVCSFDLEPHRHTSRWRTPFPSLWTSSPSPPISFVLSHFPPASCWMASKFGGRFLPTLGGGSVVRKKRCTFFKPASLCLPPNPQKGGTHWKEGIKVWTKKGRRIKWEWGIVAGQLLPWMNEMKSKQLFWVMFSSSFWVHLSLRMIAIFSPQQSSQVCRVKNKDNNVKSWAASQKLSVWELLWKKKKKNHCDFQVHIVFSLKIFHTSSRSSRVFCFFFTSHCFRAVVSPEVSSYGEGFHWKRRQQKVKTTSDVMSTLSASLNHLSKIEI